MADLQYLSVQHILRDLSTFIGVARSQIENLHSKVFVWGTGYGGTLAALARQQFPHLIDGIWSSNGFFEPTVFATGKCAFNIFTVY